MTDSNNDKMDLSLDDIIKMNNPRRGGGRGGGGSGRRGGGSFRGRSEGRSDGYSRNDFRGVSRGGVQRQRDNRQGSGQFPRSRDVPDVWKHDLYEGGNGVASRRPAPPSSGGRREPKLTISNLDYGVNDQDVEELFSEFGPLKSFAVHYDRSGRSLGTADVEYENMADAVKAMKQYNNVPLDGKPMKIQMAGDAGSGGGGQGSDDRPRSMASRLGAASPDSRPPRRYNDDRDDRFGDRRPFRGRGGRGQGRGGRGFGRGRGGRGGGRREALSKEELDAQLDEYNAKMETEDAE